LRRYDLDSVQLAVVGLAALASIAQPSLAPILFVLTIVFLVLERLLWKRTLPATPANLALVFLAACILVNPLFSVRPAVSLPISMQLLVGICLLFSVRAWATTADRLHKLLLLLCVAGLVLVVIAPFTVDWITDKYGFFSSALYARF
jgi:hypothetical protein